MFSSRSFSDIIKMIYMKNAVACKEKVRKSISNKYNDFLKLLICENLFAWNFYNFSIAKINPLKISNFTNFCPCLTLSNIENGKKPLTIFAKRSTLDLWQGSECASGDVFDWNFRNQKPVYCFNNRLFVIQKK